MDHRLCDFIKFTLPITSTSLIDNNLLSFALNYAFITLFASLLFAKREREKKKKEKKMKRKRIHVNIK